MMEYVQVKKSGDVWLVWFEDRAHNKLSKPTQKAFNKKPDAVGYALKCGDVNASFEIEPGK